MALALRQLALFSSSSWFGYGFPKVKDPFLISIIRIAFWGLHSGPPIYGKNH